MQLEDAKTTQMMCDLSTLRSWIQMKITWKKKKVVCKLSLYMTFQQQNVQNRKKYDSTYPKFVIIRWYGAKKMPRLQGMWKLEPEESSTVAHIRVWSTCIGPASDVGVF